VCKRSAAPASCVANELPDLGFPAECGHACSLMVCRVRIVAHARSRHPRLRTNSSPNECRQCRPRQRCPIDLIAAGGAAAARRWACEAGPWQQSQRGDFSMGHLIWLGKLRSKRLDLSQYNRIKPKSRESARLKVQLTDDIRLRTICAIAFSEVQCGIPCNFAEGLAPLFR
jgi:hypothetical protein